MRAASTLVVVVPSNQGCLLVGRSRLVIAVVCGKSCYDLSTARSHFGSVNCRC